MTNKEKQCLLCFMGYLDTVDGIWGPKSANATRVFQRDYNTVYKAKLTIDGLFGDNTAKAALNAVSKDFRKPSTTAPTPVVSTPATPKPSTGNSKNIPAFWKKYKYVSREEMRCKCGGKYCNGFDHEPVESLMDVAEWVRETKKKPLIISSGVRCVRHNANVGGVANSRHLYGRAMDFCVQGCSANEILTLLKQRREIKYCYAINSTYVHMDVGSP